MLIRLGDMIYCIAAAILASCGSDGLGRLGPIGLAWITTRKQVHGSQAEACYGVRSSILSRLSNRTGNWF